LLLEAFLIFHINPYAFTIECIRAKSSPVYSCSAKSRFLSYYYWSQIHGDAISVDQPWIWDQFWLLVIS